jgi:DNA-binding GntR family transcriptional regulator
MKQHRVYTQLRDAIYSGRIKPGTRLVERRLAEEFQTSRVPLRESLLRLMSEGLVRRNHRQTSYVEDLTADDVSEIWLMRETLEPVAARFAAARPEKGFIATLHTLADRMADQLARGRLAASAQFDLTFHRAIVEASGSPRLVRAYDLSHVPMLMTRLKDGRGDPATLRRQHHDYADILAGGDAAAAEDYARTHVTEVAERMPPGNGRER